MKMEMNQMGYRTVFYVPNDIFTRALDWHAQNPAIDDVITFDRYDFASRQGNTRPILSLERAPSKNALCYGCHEAISTSGHWCDTCHARHCKKCITYLPACGASDDAAHCLKCAEVLIHTAETCEKAEAAIESPRLPVPAHGERHSERILTPQYLTVGDTQ